MHLNIYLAAIFCFWKQFIHAIVSDTCLYCEALSKCEPVVCNHRVVNNTFVLDYTLGCVLSCPNNQTLQCKLVGTDAGEVLRWTQVDPCFIPTTTSTITSTSTSTTTTTTKTALTTDMTTQSYILSTPDDSISAVVPGKPTASMNTSVFPGGDVEDNTKSFNTSVFIWLVFAIIVVVLALASIGLWCYFKRRRRQGAIILGASGPKSSTIKHFLSQPISHDNNAYVAGSLRTPTSYSISHGNGRVSSFKQNTSRNRTSVSLLLQHLNATEFQPKKKTRTASLSDSRMKRKPFEWQDSGTQEFVIPPSPPLLSATLTQRPSSQSLRRSQTPPNFRGPRLLDSPIGQAYKSYACSTSTEEGLAPSVSEDILYQSRQYQTGIYSTFSSSSTTFRPSIKNDDMSIDEGQSARHVITSMCSSKSVRSIGPNYNSSPFSSHSFGERSSPTLVAERRYSDNASMTTLQQIDALQQLDIVSQMPIPVTGESQQWRPIEHHSPSPPNRIPRI